MKNIWSIILLVMVCEVSFGQVEKTIDSKITSVTVFLSKAQVTREAKTSLEAGKTSLVFTGLTSLLDPASLQVSAKGSLVILGITHRQNYLSEQNPPKQLRIWKDSAAYYERQMTIEQSQKDILLKEEQMILSNQKIGGNNQNLTAAELKSMADFFRTRMTELLTARTKQDEKLRKLNDKLTRIQNQINEQNDLYTQNTSEVVVNVSADGSTVANLELRYVVSNAGWNPIYDLRAVNTKLPVQLNYKANVFQGTGEDWNNVQLRLSTANPNEDGRKPELFAWYLDFYQPVTVSYSRGLERSKSAPASVAADRSIEAEEQLDAETMAEYVSTIQTTLNTEFNIAIPYTVISASRPTLVDIASHEMKAEYMYAVAPKLDNDAFLLAKATGWEDFNLLPGEANVFFEGTFVGKSFVDPNSIKDTLTVSLGRDKRLVVKREKVKDLTSRKLIGGSQREAYAWEITIRNSKSEPAHVIVEDQIPVSRNSQIEVTLTDGGGAKWDAIAGKLTWDLTLAPNESKKMTYRFEVKYPKDKRISGL